MTVESHRKPRPEHRLRVLIVCHNHPDIYPGGAEGYAFQVYRQLRESGAVEPFFLARHGSTASRKVQSHFGTPFSSIGEDGHQYLAYSEADDFDFLLHSLRNKELLTTHYRDFLQAIRPDVVHFQHSHFLGHDMIRETRNSLPDVPIIYSLHEYLSLCYRDGVMVRTTDEQPCMESSPRRCNECFPSISPQEFFMRKRFLQSHFQEVDQFLAPSRFLMDRYVEWGIPVEKIRYHDQGSPRWSLIPDQNGGRLNRNRFAFFGQVHPYKGIDVLLRAVKLLIEGVQQDAPAAFNEAHVWVHGANLDLQTTEFQKEVGELLQETSGRVTWAGRYEETDIPRLMHDVDWVVVPSRWWENSPRVIQEAFQFGRPVICSGMGALAEKVKHEVSGLHFRSGDPASLADTMSRAATTDGLWERLRGGIPEVRSIEDDAKALVDLYQTLRQGKQANGRTPEAR